MDALPLHETSRFAHRSQHDGMHACGHDSHTTMLLLAVARMLSQSDGWSGTVNFIFQPAEEMGKAGALKMIQAGCSALPVRGGVRAAQLRHGARRRFRHQSAGPLMASSNTRALPSPAAAYASTPLGLDRWLPRWTWRPATAHAGARVVDSHERVVLAVTQIQGSGAPNVIPDRVGGRHDPHFSDTALDALEAGLRHLAEHVAGPPLRVRGALHAGLAAAGQPSG